MPYVKDDEIPDSSGAQGKVFRATKMTPYRLSLLGRSHIEAFAIKEIQTQDSKARERLRNEIKHLRLCNHPNVLRLREAYVIEQEMWTDTTFLVTEPWAQASLHSFLRELVNHGKSRSCPWYVPSNLAPWPSIVRQCILGLMHLHQNSIRHKDLNPRNILLLDESNGDRSQPRVRPIIADLGVSKANVVGADSSFNGTHQYLAPEQHAKEASTAESDVFSLGCCFAWIHSVIASKSIKNGEEDKLSDLGPNQLDNVAAVGFANAIDEVMDLLKTLRSDQKSPK